MVLCRLAIILETGVLLAECLGVDRVDPGDSWHDAGRGLGRGVDFSWLVLLQDPVNGDTASLLSHIKMRSQGYIMCSEIKNTRQSFH